MAGLVSLLVFFGLTMVLTLFVGMIGSVGGVELALIVMLAAGLAVLFHRRRERARS
ncbi:Myxococcales GC_trans_RRR domain-containing protein [Streptoalloteichus tenebrarius]|uniref:Myxococcales GC_trans_RRR domain-containing protein n=1 Tax=Streptoalloteichus tenebrarius (strain ATCC 17920 / DSM 40477 / JCM 4838 / CBS 697.72 / NBRC 16177 / NCIMB 11028 / NRRL B-12390 / A12253. 1 / ISP 5477) TaxID=1933 RepID=A0ABT1HX17_STRSD|nr:MYXO-CTERM sorting domain-containing protein [Streptoalloteichus tenebrarius]MCP2260062.1 Myxococcales GC_trans_RRR domain-containing protein [Streptoalloteichus tenebrarius]BFF03815.1 hypothetical protein GCM10020241_54900 [Streptoalloteichus tenebrarius]